MKSITMNHTVSIAKGLGIILMVVGHSGCPTLLRDFIYLFHMPLFYFASGYCFKSSYTSEMNLFFWKKIKSFYFPFVKYAVLFLILHNLFRYLDLYNETYGAEGISRFYYSWDDTWDGLKNILFRFRTDEPLVGVFWFLKSLFITNILFILLLFITQKISRKYDLWIVTGLVLIFFIAGLWLSAMNITLPYSVNREFVTVGFFFTGFMSGKINKSYSFNKIILTIAAALLVFFASFTHIDLGATQFASPSIFILGSLIGCYLTWGCSYYLSRSSLNNLLIFIGNNTMYILVFHLLAFKLVSLAKIKIYGLSPQYLAMFPVIENNNTYGWIIYSLVGIAVPLAGYKLFNRIKWDYGKAMKARKCPH